MGWQRGRGRGGGVVQCTCKQGQEATGVGMLYDMCLWHCYVGERWRRQQQQLAQCWWLRPWAACVHCSGSTPNMLASGAG